MEVLHRYMNWKEGFQKVTWCLTPGQPVWIHQLEICNGKISEKMEEKEKKRRS